MWFNRNKIRIKPGQTPVYAQAWIDPSLIMHSGEPHAFVVGRNVLDVRSHHASFIAKGMVPFGAGSALELPESWGDAIDAVGGALEIVNKNSRYFRTLLKTCTS